MHAISIADSLGKTISINQTEIDVTRDFRHPENESFDCERIADLIDRLAPRTAEIIRLRFGINHDKPHTLKEVANKVKLTRERVRQIEREAIKMLREWAEKIINATKKAS